MSNIQFSNQENQVNFASSTTSTNTYRRKKNTQLRFLPTAIICAFVFIGAVIFAKLQTQKQLNQEANDLGQQAEVGELLREQSPQPQDTILATQEGIVSNTPVTKNPGIQQNMTASEASKLAKPTIKPKPSAKPTPVATSKPKNITPKPAVILNPQNSSTTQTTTQNPAVITEEKTVVIKADESYKPANPYMETCGEFKDGRWHNLKVVLPAFEKDGKKAVEYWLQVGTSSGSNNVFDKRFSQTDRVVFAETYDNNREYFVRFAIRMENGDWQLWSNTLSFKCEMK